MARQMFYKGDKVLVDDAGQQYTTFYRVIVQMFQNDGLDLRTIAKFRFVKEIKQKEMDWDRKQSRFTVVAVMKNPNLDPKNQQLVLIENKKHVYLIGNSGLIIDTIPNQEPTQEEMNW